MTIAHDLISIRRDILELRIETQNLRVRMDNLQIQVDKDGFEERTRLYELLNIRIKELKHALEEHIEETHLECSH